MAPHSLAALPIELLVFVIDNLGRVEDIAALALANRRLYSTANQLLYKRAAQCDDARALAWAANRGLVSTLRMALAAGIDPNHEFVECIPADEWERATAAARADAVAARAKAAWGIWDFGNQPRVGDANARWSSGAVGDGPSDSDGSHAGTPASSSTVTQSPRAPSVSDRDSVVSSEEDLDLSQRSDATPATEPSATPTPGMVSRSYHAIHLAARGGHNEVLSILLRHGAAVHLSSTRFCACTPLYGLLNALEAPRDLDPAPYTPLHAAICHAHTETAKLLLAHKAPPFMESHATIHNLHLPPQDQDIDTYIGPTALHHAAAAGLDDLITHLLTTHTLPPSAINTPDTHTLTPLYHAYAHRRWSSTIPLLLSLGADINTEAKLYIPYAAITPLGEACRLGDFDVADRLVDLGADVRKGFVAEGREGCLTPLHMCCMRSAKPPPPRESQGIAGGFAQGGGQDGGGDGEGEGQRQGTDHGQVQGQAQSQAQGQAQSPRGDKGVDQPGTGPDDMEKNELDDDEERGLARMQTIDKLIARGAKLDALDCFGSTPLMAAAQACNTFALEALSLHGAGEEQEEEESGGMKATGKTEAAAAGS